MRASAPGNDRRESVRPIDYIVCTVWPTRRVRGVEGHVTSLRCRRTRRLCCVNAISFAIAADSTDFRLQFSDLIQYGNMVVLSAAVDVVSPVSPARRTASSIPSIVSARCCVTAAEMWDFSPRYYNSFKTK